MGQYQIIRLLPAAAATASVALHQPKPCIYQVIRSLVTEHNRVRVFRTDLNMTQPAIFLQQCAGSSRSQIHIDNPAAGLRQTGFGKEIPACALLPFWKRFLQRLNHSKITAVSAYRPAVARPSFRNPVYALPFKTRQRQLPYYLFLLIIYILIIGR